MSVIERLAAMEVDGKTRFPWARRQCGVCLGAGKIRSHYALYPGADVPCPPCAGEGWRPNTNVHAEEVLDALDASDKEVAVYVGQWSVRGMLERGWFCRIDYVAGPPCSGSLDAILSGVLSSTMKEKRKP